MAVNKNTTTTRKTSQEAPQSSETVVTTTTVQSVQLSDNFRQEVLQAAREQAAIELANPNITIKFAKSKPDAIVPTYATDGSGCFDLYSADEVIIKPRETALVSTGLIMEIPEGYVLEVYPRSGISSKTFLRLPNSVGIIDSDYRGEVLIPLFNTFMITSDRDLYDREGKVWNISGEHILSEKHGTVHQCFTYIVNKGERVAQAKLVRYDKVKFEEAKLSDTARGTGGCGSTGIK